MSQYKYSNPTSKLKVVSFADGKSQFLMRGQSFIADEKASYVEVGVLEKEITANKKANTSSTRKNKQNSDTTDDSGESEAK